SVVVFPSPGGPTKKRTRASGAAGASASASASATSTASPPPRRSAVSRRSAAAMTPSTPCSTSARWSRRMSGSPGSWTSARTSAISSRTSRWSAPSTASPVAREASTAPGASRSTAAVTVTSPAASAVSRITASAPSAAFTCRSASPIVGAVNRLTFIERHHPERPQSHVGRDLAGRDERDVWKDPLDEPAHVRPDRRGAEDERREVQVVEALGPLAEPAEETLCDRRLDGEHGRRVVGLLERVEQHPLDVRSERDERQRPVGADEPFRDRAPERLPRVLGEHVGVLRPRRVIRERL